MESDNWHIITDSINGRRRDDWVDTRHTWCLRTRVSHRADNARESETERERGGREMSEGARRTAKAGATRLAAVGPWRAKGGRGSSGCTVHPVHQLYGQTRATLCKFSSGKLEIEGNAPRVSDAVEERRSTRRRKSIAKCTEYRIFFFEKSEFLVQAGIS